MTIMLTTIAIVIVAMAGTFSILTLIHRVKEIDILYKFSDEDLKEILKKVRGSKNTQSVKINCSDLIDRENWEVADKNLAIKIIQEYYLEKE